MAPLSQNAFTVRRAWLRCLPAILFLLVLVSGLPAAFAQGAGTCTVTGTVYDAAGAVVPDAQVQLVLQTTGTARDTKADDRGFFSFVGLPPGAYRIKVSSSGFADFTQKDMVLHINDQIDLKNLVLKVAALGTRGGSYGGISRPTPKFGGDILHPQQQAGG